MFGIYEISQTVNKQDFSDDTVIAKAIVVAESEDAAQHMRPSFIDNRGWAEESDLKYDASDEQDAIWAGIDSVMVRKLGNVTDPSIREPQMLAKQPA